MNLIPLPVIPIQIELPVGRSQFNSNSSSWIEWRQFWNSEFCTSLLESMHWFHKHHGEG